MRKLQVPCLMLCLASTVAMACQPPDPGFWEESAKRLKSNFDGAQFVVTADVMRVEKVSVQLRPDLDFRTEVERTSFRVAQAFKGNLKPGDTFQVDSGFTFCARGVLDDEWIPLRPPGSAYPTRWLIYYTPPPVLPVPGPQLPPFEIRSSPLSRPANLATYDIDMLTRSAGKWRGRSGR